MLRETALLFAVILVSQASAKGTNYGRDYGGDRSPTFDRDVEESSISGAGSGGRRFTYSWDKDEPAVTRSSYLDRYTTERYGYGSGSESNYGGSYGERDSDISYNRWSTRRPSYHTDRYGDVIGGSPTRSGYVTMYTTDRWRDNDFDYGRRTTPSYGGSSWGSGRRTTSSYGSSWDSYDRVTSRWSSGSGSSLSGRDRFDRDEAYLRVEFELVKLTNDKGITMDGGKCDTFGACDTVCYAYIDVERPNAEFPGSRETKYFTKVFETDDNNSPSFSRANVTREVCGIPYREATGRVFCEDHDSLSKSDIINQWDCPISRDPEISETFATWRSGECRSKKQNDQMKLTFRYKVYNIPRLRCNPAVGGLPAGASTTTTTRRRS